MWVAFALQKLLTFFQQKFQHICIALDVNFNESLTDDIFSFEQLSPELKDKKIKAVSPWFVPSLSKHSSFNIILQSFIYFFFFLNKHFSSNAVQRTC